MASTQSTILSAVKTIIDNLSLAGVDECQVRCSPSDGKHLFPGITVSPTTEEESPGTNERDDIGYGIVITMVANDDADVTEDDLIGTWRQSIRKAFIHKKLTAVTGSCVVLWEPGKYDHDNNKNLTISTMLMRVIVRETRT